MEYKTILMTGRVTRVKIGDTTTLVQDIPIRAGDDLSVEITDGEPVVHVDSPWSRRWIVRRLRRIFR